MTVTFEKEEKALSPDYEKGLKIFEELGLHPFTEEELKEMSEAFSDNVIKGLEEKDSSLQMIPTYLSPVEP